MGIDRRSGVRRLVPRRLVTYAMSGVFAGSGLFWIALGFFGDGPVWMVVVVVVVAFAIAFVLWAPATFLLAEGAARSGWPGSRWFTSTEVILVRLVEIREGPFELMLVLADGVEHRLAIINGAFSVSETASRHADAVIAELHSELGLDPSNLEHHVTSRKHRKRDAALR